MPFRKSTIWRLRPRLEALLRTTALSALITIGIGAGITQAATVHVNPQGVPITPNTNVVLTESLTRQGMLLDAESTPLLFVATWNVSKAQVTTLQQHLAHLSGLHRPLILVSTAFLRPRRAIATTTTWMHRDHVTLPVVIQEGPPTLYVRKPPVLITAVDGHLHRYAGWAAILGHLRQAVVIPAPPPVIDPTAKAGGLVKALR